MKGKRNDRTDVHVRLPRKLHEAVKSSAASNRRKINDEIIVWLERAGSIKG